MQSLAWLGDKAPYLDRPHVVTLGPFTLGCYGGTTSAGADKNEDAAYLLCPDDGAWEFAMLLDAHASSESARLMIRWCERSQARLEEICAGPVDFAIPQLSQFLVQELSSPSFRQEASGVRRETACLIVFRTANLLFWLSIGDCVVYLLHPDFMRLGQYALNQRQFYEWIGRVNTFEQPVPCFTSGVRELRDGTHTIVMLTDGVLECGTRPFADAAALAQNLAPDAAERDLQQGVEAVLGRVVTEEGRDSATIIGWRSFNSVRPAAQPSR